MIIVDKALEQRQREGNPVRVAMVGAGFMGRVLALQIVQATPGMELVAISNRNPHKAVDAYEVAGIADPRPVESVQQLEQAIADGKPAVTDDATLLCEAEGVDVLLEATGSIEFGASVVLHAIEHGKHVVLMSAELDGTLGPVLKSRADRAGVVYTVADGDQPGTTMNLFRFVVGIGVTPVLCGNIKGLHDPYRNPTTQESFAAKWGQKPTMVTSFADGTKISFEQAITANATGMRVAKRGMHGPTVEPGTPVEEAAGLYPAEDLVSPGIVEYVVGVDPPPGVFVIGTHEHPLQQHYLNLFKLGEGPFYCFYTPVHLCHFEVPSSIARAVLFHDAAVAPTEGLRVEVLTAAKVDLEAGQVLDGMGGYHAYGLAENADVTAAERLLPMGVSEGCTLRRAIPRDQVITYDDVELPPGRVCDELRAEQAALQGTAAAA